MCAPEYQAVPPPHRLQEARRLQRRFRYRNGYVGLQSSSRACSSCVPYSTRSVSGLPMRARWRQSSGMVSTKTLNVGLRPRNHPISLFDGVFVVCPSLQKFLRHEDVPHGDLPIDFREERGGGFFGQFAPPVWLFTIPLHLTR